MHEVAWALRYCPSVVLLVCKAPVPGNVGAWLSARVKVPKGYGVMAWVACARANIPSPANSCRCSHHGPGLPLCS